MTYTRAFIVAAAALALGACSEDDGPTTPDIPPLAYVRYVHAVPDTTATDWRPVDQLTYSPAALGLQFGSGTAYQGMEAGSRHLRIFTTSTDIDVTSVPLIDETIPFDAGVYYTVIHTGYARTGASPADHIEVLTDNGFTKPAGDTISVRVLNLTDTPYDVYAQVPTSTVTPMFDDVPAGARSGFSKAAKGALTLRLTAAGDTTVISSTAAPAGTGAGATVAGTMMTAIIFPGEVAPDGTVAAPQIGYLIENRPLDP